MSTMRKTREVTLRMLPTAIAILLLLLLLLVVTTMCGAMARASEDETKTQNEMRCDAKNSPANNGRTTPTDGEYLVVETRTT